MGVVAAQKLSAAPGVSGTAVGVGNVTGAALGAEGPVASVFVPLEVILGLGYETVTVVTILSPGPR